MNRMLNTCCKNNCFDWFATANNFKILLGNETITIRHIYCSSQLLWFEVEAHIINTIKVHVGIELEMDTACQNVFLFALKNSVTVNRSLKCVRIGKITICASSFF